MRCPICDSTDNWEIVDQYRFKKSGMSICNGCGFVGYPNKYKTEDEIKEHYKEGYRPPPNFTNALTGQRKLHIHAHFLKEVFDKWKDEKKTDLCICDVGAAYGIFLNWVRGFFKDADLNGTEYAESYIRNAWHEYQIRLSKDFDKSKKYDLISSFKVAEHQMDPDLRLREYVECLSDGGYMYISVPTWFEKMTNFGTGGFDLEYYYHTDHINVWTRTLFETLLKKVGLKIIKFDDWMYDETYLCQRDDSVMKEDPVYEDPKAIKEKMGRIKLSAEHMLNRDFKSAVESFPNNATAWVSYYESMRADPHKQTDKIPFEEIVENFLKPSYEACPHNLNILQLHVDLCMRYEQYQDAIKFIDQALKVRPNQTQFLMALAHCYRQMAMRTNNKQEKIDLIREAQGVSRYICEIDIGARPEATTWRYKDNAALPVEV